MAFRPSRLLQTSSMAAAPHTFLSFSSPPRLLTSPSSTLPRSSFGGGSLNLHHRQSVKTNNPVKNIHNMVMSLNFSAIEVKTINSVESWEDGVLVAVSGSVKTKEFSNMIAKAMITTEEVLSENTSPASVGNESKSNTRMFKAMLDN